MKEQQKKVWNEINLKSQRLWRIKKTWVFHAKCDNENPITKLLM